VVFGLATESICVSLAPGDRIIVSRPCPAGTYIYVVPLDGAAGSLQAPPRLKLPLCVGFGPAST
jgi:hypothetical protein